VSTGSRDKFFLVAALIGLGLWLVSISSARTFAVRHGYHGWMVDVAPSFLAAFTFAFWNAFNRMTRPLVAAAAGAAFTALAEVVQIFLPGYTADVWDAVAGVAGAAAALPVLYLRQRFISRPAP
jgi:hypothetical protein